MKFLSVAAIAGLALASAQPITYSEYVDPHKEGFDFEFGDRLLSGGSSSSNGIEGKVEFSNVLRSQPGRPSTREYLAMFSDKYVENNGRFYAVKNSQGNGAMTFSDIMRNGLYELIVPDTFVGWNRCNTNGRCVEFHLLFEAENIGQIIAAPAHYNPIQIIGVDQVTNRIYGYYPTASGTWDRKRTAWGDAKDGSMRSFDWEVIGLSTNDRMFNLWGGFANFNYGKHDDIECDGPPSTIDEWSGFLAPYRGIYCPASDDNQLWKNTWHESGWEKEKLIWTPASKITRFESGIWGISTDGKLLILWNDSGTIRSARLHLPNIHGVRAVGGLEDNYVWDSGVLLTNGNDEVYTVWWDGEWKEKEIVIDKRFEGDGQMSVLFGSHNGEVYMLYGWYDNDIPWVCRCNLHEVYLYHMKFVGGSERYQAIRIQGDLTV